MKNASDHTCVPTNNRQNVLAVTDQFLLEATAFGENKHLSSQEYKSITSTSSILTPFSLRNDKKELSASSVGR